MNAIIRFLVISAAIVIPWGFVRVANIEIEALLTSIGLSDLGLVVLLISLPIAWLLTKWLFGPRGRQNKRYSSSKNVMMKFRG